MYFILFRVLFNLGVTSGTLIYFIFVFACLFQFFYLVLKLRYYVLSFMQSIVLCTGEASAGIGHVGCGRGDIGSFSGSSLVNPWSTMAWTLQCGAYEEQHISTDQFFIFLPFTPSPLLPAPVKPREQGWSITCSRYAQLSGDYRLLGS